MNGTWKRRTIVIALMAALTGVGLLAKPLVGAAESAREADGARRLLVASLKYLDDGKDFNCISERGRGNFADYFGGHLGDPAVRADSAVSV